IIETVNKELAGKYLWLFPKSNILIYPQSKIGAVLESKFKSIQSVSLSVKSDKGLWVFLSEREPKYTWCGDALPASGSEEKCYFMDESGYIFSEAPFFSGKVYFRFYGLPGVNGEDPLGSYYLKQNFTGLVHFNDLLLSMGLKPEKAYIDENGDTYIYLAKTTASKTVPELILRDDADFEKVAENLQAALGTEPLQSKFKNEYSLLQYIDLRFDNKVYDKF
ncbi:MAG: hypothetical protein ACREGC_03825, partial [Minisyncoccia bacterium]